MISLSSLKSTRSHTRGIEEETGGLASKSMVPVVDLLEAHAVGPHIGRWIEYAHGVQRGAPDDMMTKSQP
jgi:hypothetical protein